MTGQDDRYRCEYCGKTFVVTALTDYHQAHNQCGLKTTGRESMTYIHAELRYLADAQKDGIKLHEGPHTGAWVTGCPRCELLAVTR